MGWGRSLGAHIYALPAWQVDFGCLFSGVLGFHVFCGCLVMIFLGFSWVLILGSFRPETGYLV